MKGNMQNMDLTIPKLIEHAERYTSDTLIVSRETDNSIFSSVLVLELFEYLAALSAK